MLPSPKSIILLFGPTAVGKTELLRQIFAKRAEIISADSMQVYRGLDIGTAKPGRDTLKILPHHLISILDPKEQYTVGDFVRRADDLLTEIAGRGKIPIIAGGTAYYFKHFLYGLPETPAADQEIRSQLQALVRTQGLEPLLAELHRVDPVSEKKISPNDAYRVIRALEVFRITGKPLSTYKTTGEERYPGRSLLIGLQRPREDLYNRIDQRVEGMFSDGLEAEVRGILQDGYTFKDPGMKAIGYQEFSGYQNGTITLEETKELVKKNTRHYAKRQITFFKTVPGVSWFDASSIEAVKRHLLETVDIG